MASCGSYSFLHPMREGFELAGREVDDHGLAAVEDVHVETAVLAGPEVDQRMLLQDEVNVTRFYQPVPFWRSGRIVEMSVMPPAPACSRERRD